MSRTALILALAAAAAQSAAAPTPNNGIPQDSIVARIDCVFVAYARPGFAIDQGRLRGVRFVRTSD